MARYIDADNFKLRIKASPAFPNIGMDGYFLLDVVIDLLNNMPTADVTPKSEVDKALQYGYERGKRQAASEIHNALYKEIIEARNSNFEEIKERERKYNVNRYEDTFCNYCNGKIHALDGIYYFVSELMKKYEEVKKDE